MDQALVKKRLISRAADVTGRQYDRAFSVEIINLMHEPNFQDRTGWKSAIDEELIAVWHSFPDQSKLALYITAVIATKTEEDDDE